MRSKVLTMVVISIFLLSMTATPHAQTANFELTLVFPADVLYYDSISRAIEQQLAPLLVDVVPSGLFGTGYGQLLTTFDFDMAILSLDSISSEFPPLWNQFHPDSFTGQDFYRTSDSNIMSAAQIDDTDYFFNLLDIYKNASTEQEKIDLAYIIQQEYNSKWLLDIPLISTATIVSSWNSFQGYDYNEGLINSLFLGASWSSNPQERQSVGRTDNEFHTAYRNFEQTPNPLYYQSRGGYLASEALYSTVFLKDAANNLHPNLAIAYNTTTHQNGSSTWTLHLREDASWSDGEPLDAFDIKFTYDLATFEWMGSTDQNSWDSVNSIEIIDDFTIQVHFGNNALTNRHVLANQFIIPEHVLNVTINDNGVDRHPYDGYNPSTSDLWDSFVDNPVTAGPFFYDSINSRDSQVEEYLRNDNYWSPSIYDSPNQIFDLNSNTTGTPYYFDGIDEIELNKLVYHTSGSQNIDPNTFITTYRSGSRDMIELNNIDSGHDLFDDSSFRVESIGNQGGGLVVLMNPENSELAQYGVRKAINQAINRAQIASLVGLGHIEQKTPVSRYYGSYYDVTSEIVESYDQARDRFRELGYDALDDTTAEDNFEWPWERLPVPIIPLLMTFALLAVIRKSRR